MMKKDTCELLQILKSIDSSPQLEHVINNYFENGITLTGYLEEMMAKHQVKKQDAVKRSGLYRSYAYQILSGIKQPSRDKLIALCLGIGLGLDETQKALTVSEQGPLYSKKKRDAIIIFAINKKVGIDQLNLLLYDYGQTILE